MPIKKNPNSVSIRTNNSSTLSFFTFNKKAHFSSEGKLFDELKTVISGISPYVTCHLTTYPYIAVHIEHGIAEELNRDKKRYEIAIQKTLEHHLKP
jgi:hypothetical protein